VFYYISFYHLCCEADVAGNVWLQNSKIDVDESTFQLAKVILLAERLLIGH